MSRIYKPANFCIYCGAKDPPGGLGEEHIVPFALGGTLVLPEASCRDCERITGAKVEQQVLRKMLGELRGWQNLPRRKRKKDNVYRPRPIRVEVDGRWTDIEGGASAGLFAGAALPVLGQPGILLGEQPLVIRKEKFELIWMNVAIESRTREYVSRAHPGYTNIGNVALFNPVLWARMLAKIGHSFAVAEYGLDRFNPLLPDYICEKKLWCPGYLVGGDPDPVSPSKYGIELRLIEMSIAGVKKYLLVKIRLFGTEGAPVYFAVVGEL